MNITQQRSFPQQRSGWDNTYSDDLAYKFTTYDKNKDGILDKVEFRALLKDVFSSQQSSTQFLDDAIEETVWRESRVDLQKVRQVSSTSTLYAQLLYFMQSIDNIRETFCPPEPKQSAPSKPAYAQSSIPPKPYNAQGQSLPPPAAPFHAALESRLPLPPPMTTKHNLGGRPPQMSNPPPLPPRNLPVEDFNPFNNPPPSQPLQPRPQAYQSSAPANNPFHSDYHRSETAPTLPVGLEKGPAPIRVLPTAGMPGGKASLNSVAQISKDESRAFVEYINTNAALKDDPDVNHVLPITNDRIYDVVSEGWLFWYLSIPSQIIILIKFLSKMLNTIQPNIIAPASIKLRPKNAFEKIENHTLALGAAKKLGCSIVNIGPEDLLQGKPRLVLGLLWQIIKVILLQRCIYWILT